MVITSGGVGPTHDDKTYEGVATAFRLPLHFHAEVADMVAVHHGGSPSDLVQNPALKMALVPATCRLHRVPDTRGTTISKAIVQVHNVYIFPGRLLVHAARRMRWEGLSSSGLRRWILPACLPYLLSMVSLFPQCFAAKPYDVMRIRSSLEDRFYWTSFGLGLGWEPCSSNTCLVCKESLE